MDPFASAWRREPGRAAALVSVLRSATETRVPAVAVGLNPGRLSLARLDTGGVVWSRSIKADGVPVIAGSVVVVASNGALHGFDAMTGRSLWSVPASEVSLGSASDDGALTLVSVVSRTNKSELLAIARDGAVALRLRTPRTIGSVQAAATLGFVPWDGRTVSVIRLATGEEELRASFPFTIRHAFRAGGEAYFGGDHHLVHFDERTETDTPSGIELPHGRLPDNPRWQPNGVVLEASGADEGRPPALYARPVLQGTQIALQNGRLVGVWGQLVVGIDSTRAEALWVRTLEASPLAVAAGHGGYAICNDKGHAIWIDHDGRVTDRRLFDEPVGTCVLQIGNLEVAGGAPLSPLLEQLTVALAVRGSGLARVQVWLTARLGSLPEAEATRALIDIASDSTMPPTVSAQAKLSLARRTNGVDFMLQALARHYDFLEETMNPPPVGALAIALARAREVRAAPLLADQLNDPTNSASDVEQAAQALESLATPEQAEALSIFLSLYRATADQPELVAAVVSVARALIRVGGEAAVNQVKHAASDPLTLPEIRRQLLGLRTEPPRDAGS